MVVLAFLTDPAVVRKILEHLGLFADRPAPAPPICPFDEPVSFSDHAIVLPDADPPFIHDDAPTSDPRGPP